MSTTVLPNDPTFQNLSKGNNLRWPASEADSVSRIEVCQSADDVAEALQKAVKAGLRPTVRSSGHCYEDFIANNPGGVLLDVKHLNDMNADGSGHAYKISAGTPMGDAYDSLYKTGVTLPGASCTSVAAGGHICGGGYGVLSRLQGLTVDWVSAVDILTVDHSGHVAKRRVDSTHEPDLFRACRGGGGNNFGIVTAYYFDKLPQAPKEVANARISFPWEGMTPERLEAIMTTYGHYQETRAKDPDTWGLFTALGLSHRNSRRIGISAQFCNPDGTCDDLSVLNEFLDLFQPCKPVVEQPQSVESRHSPETGTAHILTGPDGSPLPCSGPHNVNRQSWYSATVRGGGGGGIRAKYKSCYMKQNFTKYEARILYKHLTREIPGANLSGIVAVDNYGGATNRPELAHQTAVSQRASIMKLQFQSYWMNPGDDAVRLQWMHDLYEELYSDPENDAKHKGTPYHGHQYEGCYINYPDVDMLAYPFWPQLYYGEKVYPFLQKVKRRYDPNNIFHHSMSVRA